MNEKNSKLLVIVFTIAELCRITFRVILYVLFGFAGAPAEILWTYKCSY